MFSSLRFLVRDIPQRVTRNGTQFHDTE